jgi:hypothetical protein
MVADFQADELIVVTITHDFKARLRSYELLAEAFELPGAATDTAVGGAAEGEPPVTRR